MYLTLKNYSTVKTKPEILCSVSALKFVHLADVDNFFLENDLLLFLNCNTRHIASRQVISVRLIVLLFYRRMKC